MPTMCMPLVGMGVIAGSAFVRAQLFRCKYGIVSAEVSMLTMLTSCPITTQA